MKIRRLDLHAYGPFTDRSLDFGPEPGGLALVYGLNEAGKSALRRAIHAWLFGIETRTSDNFVHPYKNLRIGGALASDAGEALDFVRVKSRNNSLRNPSQADAFFPDGVLGPYLRGIDRDAFEQLYSIDHTSLREGGRELQRLEGSAGESLFAAGLGIRGLSKVLEQLKTDAEAIYTKGTRRKALIPTAIREYKDLTKQRKQAECSPAHWDKVNRALRKTKRQHQELVAKKQACDEQRARLRRIASVLAEAGKRRQLSDELAACDSVSGLPAAYDPRRRQQSEETLRRLALQTDKLTRKLDGDAGLIAQRAALSLPAQLVERSPLISQLHRGLGEYEGFCVDQPKREAELQRHDGAAAEIAADLQLGPDPDAWQAGICGSELTAEIKQLIADRRQLDADKRALHEQVGEVEAELRALASSGNAKAVHDDDGEDLNALRLATDAARRKEESAVRRARVAQERESALADLGRELAALPFWSGSAEDLETLGIPLRADIERLHREADELERRDKDLTEAKEANALERRNLLAAQDKLCHGGTPATREAVEDARARREVGWHLVRSAWVEGVDDAPAVARFTGDGSTSLADAYEQSVLAADETSDELGRNADVALRLEHNAAALNANQQQASDLAERAAALTQAHAALETEWRALWSGIGIAKPGAPVVMLEWLDSFAQLKARAITCRKLGEELASLDATLDEHRRALMHALPDDSVPPNPPGMPFELLVQHCGRVLAARTELLQELAAARERLASIHKRRESCAGREAQQGRELDEWQRSWAAAMERLGVAGTPAISAIEARLARLEELRMHLRDRLDLEHRIEAMSARRTAFEDELRALVAEVAPDLHDRSVVDAVTALQEQHDRAKADRVKRGELDKQIANCRSELGDAALEAEQAKHALDELCALVGVPDPSALPQAEKSADEKRKLEASLTELDDRLLHLGGGATVDELLTEAKGQHVEAVEAEIAALTATMTNMDAERDELAGALRERQREVEAVSGNDDGAEADERALAALSRVRLHADHYLRLRLAGAILRRRIEEHQAAHEDPVLARASVLFREFTCGAFSGLVLGVDGKGHDVIQGVRAELDGALDLNAFSDGTADQLYLALRLAHLEHAADGRETMPLIIDDILVDFDEPRSRATLKVLGEIAESRQVLLLTHHEHVRALARDVVEERVELELS